MTNSYGFAGKMLYVNLSSGNIFSKSLDRQLAEKFIGGPGIGSWLAYNMIKKDVDPLSPDNVLIFSVSPLVGTLSPATSRVYANARSPISGLLGQDNAGHSMGVMMKYAGYDHLIITGRAEKPVYLKILDDDVEILDAHHLWGKDTWKTTEMIWKDIGDYWVDCIGPAAENLARFSIVLCSKRSSFNKASTGTVMASKNLKAIAVRGTKGVKVADPEKFMQLANIITKRIIRDPDLKTWRQFGGPYRSSPGFTSEEYLDRITKKSYACLSCPVGCKRIIDLKDGKYEGLNYRFSHLASQMNHGHLAFIENWDELVKCIETLNRYGLETSSTAAMLNYIFECYNHGLLKEEDIGYKPKLGGEALRELIFKIAKREGIGDLASEGLLIASQKIKGSDQYAQHVKGVGRENNLDKVVNLGNIGTLTSPRGGKPETSQIPFGDGGTQGVNPETFRRFCSDLGLAKETADRICSGIDGFNLGRLLKWAQDYNTLYTSMGFCIRAVVMRHVNLNELAELYVAATGIEISSAQLLKAGERVFNVLKAFNIRSGATRLDDMPSRGIIWDPDKLLIIANKNYGSLNDILSQYYDERGWDVETGIPTIQKLEDLGLQNIANDLLAS